MTITILSFFFSFYQLFGFKTRNKLNRKYSFMFCSRVLFDTPQEDPSYAPLPEDQSGISWNGQGVEDTGQGQNEEDPEREDN